MPGFRTHYIFGQEAAKEFKDSRLLSCLSKYPHSYNLGLQGPDVFFYGLPSHLFHGKNIGITMHGERTLAFSPFA